MAVVFLKSVDPADPQQHVLLHHGQKSQFLRGAGGAELTPIFSDLSQSPNTFQSANANAIIAALQDEGWRLHPPDHRGPGFRRGAGRFGEWTGEE